MKIQRHVKEKTEDVLQPGELKKLHPANPLHSDYHPAALLLPCASLAGPPAPLMPASSVISICLPDSPHKPPGCCLSDLSAVVGVTTAFVMAPKNHKACLSTPALRPPWLLVASMFRSYWVEGDLKLSRQNHHIEVVMV